MICPNCSHPVKPKGNTKIVYVKCGGCGKTSLIDLEKS